MATIAELAVNVVARTGGMQRGLNSAGRSLTTFNQKVQRSIGLATQLLGVGGGFAGLGFAAKLAAEAEQMEVSFSVMLGSGEQAMQMMKDLKETAASTPLQLTDLTRATRTLLAFGVAGEDIIPTLRMLGDTAGGESERLRSMALAFGQIQSAGRLMGQDLLQLINAGFNPLQEISNRTGESMLELKDRMSEGRIGIDEVKQAFQDATGPGGRFFNLMEKQSQTLAGRFSTLKDNVAELFRTFGEELLPVMNKAVDLAGAAVRVFGSLDSGTKQLVISGGAFVAAFGAAVFIIPKVIAAMQALRAIYTALITRQVLLQALSGPKGWATLAIGVGVATGALIAMNEVLKETNNEVAKVTKGNPNGTPKVAVGGSLRAGAGGTVPVKIVGGQNNQNNEMNQTLQQTNEILRQLRGDVQDSNVVQLAAGF